MKKIISILLALSMLFSLNTVAFAAESGTTDELQIVEENGTRTVSLNDGELTYIVTYDTVNNTICVGALRSMSCSFACAISWIAVFKVWSWLMPSSMAMRLFSKW